MKKVVYENCLYWKKQRSIGFEECGYIAGINHPVENFPANSEIEYVGKAGIGEIFFRKIFNNNEI